MRDPAKKPHPLVSLRMRYHDTYDAVSLFVYLVAIYIWSLKTYPMGRDFEALAGSGENLPAIAGHLFRAEIALFGTWLPGYHLVNLLLLYACTMCVYYLTNLTVRGPWWFGTLSACLFMANPVHSEAILNISGVTDIIPCFFGLLVLTAYAWQVKSPAPWKFVVALALLLLASITFPSNATLVLVIVLFELLAARTGERSVSRLGVFLLAGIVGMASHTGDLITSGLQLSQRFVPLYFLFYPLGFLPKTVVAFDTHPWLAWLAVAAVIGILILIYRKARRPVILFGLLSMAALRFVPLERSIDFATLIGGGQLLLANALFTIALVALFLRIMDHPKWRVSMIGITTTLVIILFAMQFISVRRWHEAGQRVASFQAQAREASIDGPIGVLPDYRDYYGAPMNLSDAIAHDSIFSTAIPAVSILPLRAERSRHRVDTLTEWGPAGGVLTISGELPKPVAGIFPDPVTVSRSADPVRIADMQIPAFVPLSDATVRLSTPSAELLSIAITQHDDPLPEIVIPGRSGDG